MILRKLAKTPVLFHEYKRGKKSAILSYKTTKKTKIVVKLPTKYLTKKILCLNLKKTGKSDKNFCRYNTRQN